jgi:hypothetical protein
MKGKRQAKKPATATPKPKVTSTKAVKQAKMGHRSK